MQQQNEKKSPPYIHRQGIAPHEDIPPSASCPTPYLKRGSTYDHIHDASCAMKTRADRTHSVDTQSVDVCGLQYSWLGQLFPFWTTAFHCRNSQEPLNTYQAAWLTLAERTTQNIDGAIAATLIKCTDTQYFSNKPMKWKQPTLWKLSHYTSVVCNLSTCAVSKSLMLYTLAITPYMYNCISAMDWWNVWC